MKESSRPNGFTVNSTKHFKEELTPNFFKFIQKIEEEGTCPDSSDEVKITMISKLVRGITIKNLEQYA